MNYSNFFQNNRPMPMPQIDIQQLLQLTATLDKQSLQRLVQLARAQHISEEDIRKGLELITKNH